MNRLSSPARKATAAATSAGSPGRPIGTMAAHALRRLAPYQRIRRIEFMERRCSATARWWLPKTISGKIRRVELRARENSCQPDISAGEHRDR
jgi:acetyl-CoA synthetase